MKVWITKYALTRGIIGVESKEAYIGGYCVVKENQINKNGRDVCVHLVYGDWDENKESAINKAEEMRKKKIAGLKKQIKKLERMRFE